VSAAVTSVASIVAVLVTATLAPACSNSGQTAASSSGAAPPLEGRELVVFGASSLANVFDEIGGAFERAHPGVIVTFNLGPSDGLARQIQSEGTADVFASASPAWMDVVQRNPGVVDRVDFARNRLVLVTPLDNPAGISSLRDLANDGVQLILTAEGVPLGSYARRVLDNAGIADAALANVVSNEDDAASLVQKIRSGEADAAIVYRSDIVGEAAGDLHAIDIPKDVNVVALYPIAIVEGSDESELASEFIDDVTGPLGQAALARFGFEPLRDST
jgi:molybdate transport system substrate-binding protein